SLIAKEVPLGAAIACVTPADHLIAAGVSHWGAYGLIAGLAVARPDWRDALLAGLDPATDQRILEILVSEGPAVAGVTRQRTLTIDGLEPAAHRAKLDQVREVVLARGGACG